MVFHWYPRMVQTCLKLLVVLIAHNLSGLLFHLPLTQLIYSHLREKEDSWNDESTVLCKVPWLSPYSLVNDSTDDTSKLPFSTIMRLNIVTDLCRLLSHGYYHLYHVFNIINNTSLLSHLSSSISLFTSTDFIPLTLYEQLSQQYQLFITQSTLENEHSNNFYYMRYLQVLQKVIYLVIIDDYLTVFILLSSLLLVSYSFFTFFWSMDEKSSWNMQYSSFFE